MCGCLCLCVKASGLLPSGIFWTVWRSARPERHDTDTWEAKAGDGPTLSLTQLWLVIHLRFLVQQEGVEVEETNEDEAEEDVNRDEAEVRRVKKTFKQRRRVNWWGPVFSDSIRSTWFLWVQCHWGHTALAEGKHEHISCSLIYIGIHL